MRDTILRSAESGTMCRRWQTTSIACLIGLLILILPRLVDINHFIDSDEAFSILLARHDFTEFAGAAIQDRPHPPLHVFLLFIITHLYLDTALLGRLLGITGSVVGFYFIARMAFRETKSEYVAIAVLLIFAFSNFFLYYSTVIRPYSIIIPLACGQLYFFISMVSDAHACDSKVSISNPALRWWTLFSVLLMCTQYLSIPVTATEFLMILPLMDRQAIMRSVSILSVAVLGLACWYYLGSLNSPSLTEAWWVKEKPSLREFVYLMLLFFGAAPVSVMWLGAVLALVYANALFKWRQLKAFDMALTVVVLAPLGLVFMLSVLGPLNIFAQRQFIAPALALVILTCSLTRLMHRAMQSVCLVLIVVWAASSLPMGLPRFSKPPFDEIAASLAARGVQRVYTTNWEFSGLSFYAGSRFGVTNLSIAKQDLDSKIEPGAGFVCRPDKCLLIYAAIRSSGAHICSRRLRWNMNNYALSQNVLIFFPFTGLRADETCSDEFLPA
jgi:hypothetical protein